MPVKRSLSLRSLIDPVTLLMILGVTGFVSSFQGRFMVFVAVALAAAGLVAVSGRRWEIAIPIQTFFLGGWAYNFLEGRPHALTLFMLIVFAPLGYGFYRLLDRPNWRHLTIIHGLYLAVATLVVWELAVLIALFWPVEPWSRTFLVVAALVFFERALFHRLRGHVNAQPLFVPLIIVLTMALIVIFSTQSTPTL